ncbi:MAG: hypothetical protein B7Z15_07855 [Rhizobiales bacterium 32-66-8]|nr:MAG: hypothetical protein B7Z15_07855 [Rhizobiales bacterium 32-66-8]
MRTEDRKAAVTAYKERKIERGLYAVRCTSSGEVWIGGSPDLSKIQNRLWFTLRHGGNTHRSLQAAWDAYGADAFTFEIVERLVAEESGYIREKVMTARLAHWAGKLQAVRI